MKRWVEFVAFLGIAIGVGACREEGPMEKAGRKVDEAMEELAHGDEGSLERAGRKLDEALEKEDE